MIKKLYTHSIALLLISITASVIAEDTMTAGKAKTESCASCHGEDGNSIVPTFPKLAGQHASYLVKQLHAFKDNTRNAPMMAPLAMGLDEETIKEIAAYYASQKITSNQLPVLESDEDDEPAITKDQLDELIALGQNLYRNGNLKTKVSACIACHGSLAEGNKPASFPALRSQHADYLIKSLTDFKSGTRNTDSDNMMQMIAKKMTDKEIQAVSYYISMIK